MSNPGFGIYMHWPFCAKKCPYCDFNSHVRAQVDYAAWQTALLTELEYLQQHSDAEIVTSIFFGGGTPSLMPPEIAAALIARVKALWAVEKDLEITLEANPTTAEAGRFKEFQRAGINRLSMGIQALRDDALQFLGRNHGAAEAIRAISLAREIFPRISFDLIYARADQTIADWQAELEQALALAVDHLSLYQLTIEPGTQFHTLHQRGELPVLGDENAAALFDFTQEFLASHGLPAYEISNHAKPGAECRHNLTYWRYGNYLGTGPGAHGRMMRKGQKYATRTHRAPEEWLNRVAQHGHGLHTPEPISPSQQRQEALLMGLRLSEGVDLARHDLWRKIDRDKINRLVEHGYVQLVDQRLIATEAGRVRLNALIEFLDVSVDG